MTTSRPKTTTVPAPRTVTPTKPSGLTILNSACTYLPVPYVLTGTQTASNIFNIDLVSCVSDASINAVFVKAAQRWMSIITGDVADITPEQYSPITDCATSDTGVAALSCTAVDDLVIVFDVLPIDGTGGTLAQAGPYTSRMAGQPGQYLSISGVMTFDSAGELSAVERSETKRASGAKPAVVFSKDG